MTDFLERLLLKDIGAMKQEAEIAKCRDYIITIAQIQSDPNAIFWHPELGIVRFAGGEDKWKK